MPVASVASVKSLPVWSSATRWVMVIGLSRFATTWVAAVTLTLVKDTTTTMSSSASESPRTVTASMRTWREFGSVWPPMGITSVLRSPGESVTVSVEDASVLPAWSSRAAVAELTVPPPFVLISTCISEPDDKETVSYVSA